MRGLDFKVHTFCSSLCRISAIGTVLDFRRVEAVFREKDFLRFRRVLSYGSLKKVAQLQPYIYDENTSLPVDYRPAGSI